MATLSGRLPQPLYATLAALLFLSMTVAAGATFLLGPQGSSFRSFMLQPYILALAPLWGLLLLLLLATCFVALVVLLLGATVSLFDLLSAGARRVRGVPAVDWEQRAASRSLAGAGYFGKDEDLFDYGMDYGSGYGRNYGMDSDADFGVGVGYMGRSNLASAAAPGMLGLPRKAQKAAGKPLPRDEWDLPSLFGS